MGRQLSKESVSSPKEALAPPKSDKKVDEKNPKLEKKVDEKKVEERKVKAPKREKETKSVLRSPAPPTVSRFGRGISSDCRLHGLHGLGPPQCGGR